MVLTKNEKDLLQACDNVDIKKVEQLLRAKTDVDCQDEKGWTPLLNAVYAASVQLTDIVLKARANVDKPLPNGRTPLYVACEKNYTDVAQLLLNKGASVDLGSEDNTTPLFIASERNNFESVKTLLAAGANPDVAKNTGATPLYIASQNSHEKVTELLLKSGANVDLSRTDTTTPLFIACEKNNLEIVKMLLAAGAQVDLANMSKATPLYVASQNNLVEVVKQLLEYGANVDLARNDGMTPLSSASYKGNAAVVKLLLEAKANTDLQDKDGDTAVHNACTGGHIEAVEELIAAHADLSIKNKNGKTPLDIAKDKEHTKIVGILQAVSPNHQKPAKPAQSSTTRTGEAGSDTSKSNQPLLPTSSVKVQKSQSNQVEFKIDLSDLEFGDFLGEGTAGAVFRGRWKSRNLDVALKKCNVPPEASDASVLSQLGEHPNLVTFYGFSYDYPQTIIVMELAANGSLYDYLYKKNIKLSLEQSMKWAKQIAYGMAYLHRHDIVHRDLKSHNVLLSGDMEPLLCDFGLARTMKKTTKASSVGTYEWMAPEVAFGGDVNQKSDVYSYAMVLWELMEQKLPFGDVPNGLVAAVKAKEGERPPIGNHWPKYLSKLVQDCWAPNPYDRPVFEVIIRAINTKTY